MRKFCFDVMFVLLFLLFHLEQNREVLLAKRGELSEISLS